MTKKISAENVIRKGAAVKDISAEAMLHKYIPQRKISAERLFYHAQKMLSKIGKGKIDYKFHQKKDLKKYTDTRRKDIENLEHRHPTYLRRLYGDETNKNDIAWIYLSEKGKDHLRGMRNIKGLYQKSMDDISLELRRIYNKILAVGAKEINLYVPKDTGMLRWSLLASLGKRLSIVPSFKPSASHDLELRVILTTDLPYVKYVNTQQKGRKFRIAHHRSMKIRSRKTGEYLHDPDAKFGFMSLIRLHLKEHTRKATRSMLSSLANKWGMNYNYIKSLFKYQGFKFR